MGAPVGNQNAAKAKVWSAAIERAFSARSKAKRREEMDELASTLIDLAFAGDVVAMKEIGDRLEGKPHQSVDANLSGQVTVNINSGDAGL